MHFMTYWKLNSTTVAIDLATAATIVVLWLCEVVIPFHTLSPAVTCTETVSALVVVVARTVYNNGGWVSVTLRVCVG